ncbi:MAG: hypothetical protein GF308_04240 [Candidatus Heimdallarchaeota archaeon]|nr:hypothetical protein [Candidatus Heimdallarchaeota archaeon]
MAKVYRPYVEKISQYYNSLFSRFLFILYECEVPLGYAINCMKCGRSRRFLYYCEDCYGTFCNKCLVTEKTDCTYCRHCAQFLGTANKCPICGSANYLTTAKRFVRKCPICASTRFKDLSTKIKGLPNEYNELINLLNQGVTILHKFALNYSEIVKQVKYLRQEQFGLYPNLENDLFRVEDHFYEITRRATELLEQTYSRIYNDARNLSLNRLNSLNRLPEIDRAFKMIKTHTNTFSNILKEFLKEPKGIIEEITQHLKELNDYLAIFNTYSHEFEPDIIELKIAAFLDVKVSFPGEFRKKGILFLTNKNLYFLPKRTFIFNFFGKVRSVPIKVFMDIKSKESTLFGAKLIIKLSENQNIRVKCSSKKVNYLLFLFKVLQNNNEGYVIKNPYLTEKLDNTLDFSTLQKRVERRIKDLKSLPFISKDSYSRWKKDSKRTIKSSQESAEAKQLRISLKAAKDTLRQLKNAFEDRCITPEIYFSRREKTLQRILVLEERLKEARV